VAGSVTPYIRYNFNRETKVLTIVYTILLFITAGAFIYDTITNNTKTFWE